MTVGEKIAILRKQNKMSQETFAAKLNVSRQTISKWENNIVVPDSVNLIEISKIFNISLDYLVDNPNSISDNETKKKINKVELSTLIIINLILLIILFFVFGIFGLVISISLMIYSYLLTKYERPTLKLFWTLLYIINLFLLLGSSTTLSINPLFYINLFINNLYVQLIVSLILLISFITISYITVKNKTNKNQKIKSFLKCFLIIPITRIIYLPLLLLNLPASAMQAAFIIDMIVTYTIYISYIIFVIVYNRKIR